MLDKKKLSEALAKMLEDKGKRKFVQSAELIINMRGIDFSKSENRLNLDIVLPKGKGGKEYKEEAEQRLERVKLALENRRKMLEAWLQRITTELREYKHKHADRSAPGGRGNPWPPNVTGGRISTHIGHHGLLRRYHRL